MKGTYKEYREKCRHVPLKTLFLIKLSRFDKRVSCEEGWGRTALAGRDRFVTYFAASHEARFQS